MSARYSATPLSRIALSVNGREALKLVTPFAGQNQQGWTTASSVQTPQNGANHIRLTVTGKSGTKIDELTVIPVSEPTSPATHP